MLDMNLFTETLRAVQEVAKTSNEPMDRETALSYFKEMELNEEQEELIYQFLSLPREEREGTQETEAETEEAEEETPEISEEEIPTQTPHFQLYVEEVNQIAELDQSVEVKLYQALLSGDTSVIAAISTQWLRRVIIIAEEYRDRGSLIDDLVQEGNMGLLMELHNLAATGTITGENIQMQLHGAVQNAIEDFLGEESGEEQQSETILGKVSLVHAAQKYLTEEKGQKPSIEELAEYTRISAEEIDDILSLLKEK